MKRSYRSNGESLHLLIVNRVRNKLKPRYLVTLELMSSLHQCDQ